MLSKEVTGDGFVYEENEFITKPRIGIGSEVIGIRIFAILFKKSINLGFQALPVGASLAS